MKPEILFGLSVLMSFIAFGIVTTLYILPRLRTVRLEDGLVALMIPHTFRFIGLSFLFPGVVSPSLSSEFTHPAAYGDLVAAVLAIVAIGAVSARSLLAIPLAWLFNVWGAADLLFAIYQGELGVRIEPGSLGATFFVPTAVVPPLLVLHGLIFWILLRAGKHAMTHTQ
jgi:hypothetical protein